MIMKDFAPPTSLRRHFLRGFAAEFGEEEKEPDCERDEEGSVHPLWKNC